MSDAAEAAGQAAKDEALEAEWPPTRENAEGIGAAAGAAAGSAGCAALGAPAASPICGQIGGLVGEYVGAAVYDFIDSITGNAAAQITAEALEYAGRETNAARLIYESSLGLFELHGRLDPAWRDRMSGEPQTMRFSGNVYTSYTVSRGQRIEITALQRWGANGPHIAKQNPTQWTKNLIAAEAARAAELIAEYQLPTVRRSLSLDPINNGSPTTGIVVLGAALGAGWVLFRMLR